MTEEMVRYYALRAQEYDRVYTMERWRADLAVLHPRVATRFAGRRVFEVACGTGYWTERLAAVALAIEAGDTNEETLAVARARGISDHVRLVRRDAYAPCAGAPTFDAGFAGLWLSHVDRARMTEFAFHSYLLPGAPVLMFDERDAPARTVPTSRTDAAGNRYEPRRLASGDRFEIVKNFFDGDELRRLLVPYGRDVVNELLEAFWVVTYTASGRGVRQSTDTEG